jgi:hypothetical protein
VQEQERLALPVLDDVHRQAAESRRFDLHVAVFGVEVRVREAGELGELVERQLLEGAARSAQAAQSLTARRRDT